MFKYGTLSKGKWWCASSYGESLMVDAVMVDDDRAK
ncbi:hypothetical protein Gotri_019272 [Gossypium trilobum]|uniref:Uncharacterized protein n=1 Tax=Gossypium trilobum TaxID=34281 RepID=A0A7J9ECD0_9ROSI|nr:hypothetical protein [Gossypium trilobum]